MFQVICLQLILMYSLSSSESNVKLPENVKPENYNLKILVNFDQFKYGGFVEILIKCYEETASITLHSKKHTITDSSIAVRSAQSPEISIEIDKILRSPKEDFLKIFLKTNLEKNMKYFVDVEFAGEIREETYGFYRVIFKDANDTLHKIAVTHFEPIYARVVFPCFDEPSMKATFEAVIGRFEKQYTLSNMPLLKIEPIDGKEGWFYDYFKKTLPMSTYLFAFAVLDDGFDKVRAGDINIWIRKDLMSAIDFAREKSSKFMQFYENYLEINYELPKLDFLAVSLYPSHAGATESWGLITYDEANLKEDTDLVSTFVSHEIAHQWFGNLITMKSFGQLWLKEGIVSYMQLLAREKVLERETIEFDLTQNFMTSLTILVSHTLSEGNPENLYHFMKMIDSTTYVTGSLIIRMIEMFLGRKDLKPTWKYLLQNFKFGNFDEDDFWSVIQKTVISNNFPSELNFSTVMKSWTRQSGFPIVEITRDFVKGTATLIQRQFYGHPSGTKLPCWWIPISYTTKSEGDVNNTLAKKWMNCPRTPMKITNLKSKDWILVNLQMSGLYVVKYDETNWKLLSDSLKNIKTFDIIPPYNRFQLIFDGYLLTLLEQFKHEILLNALLYLEHETHYSPWAAAETYFNKILSINKQIFEKMIIYIRMVVRPHYRNINFSHTEMSLTKYNFQQIIVRLACKSKLKECIQDSENIINVLREKPEKNLIAPSFRKIVYCTTLSYGRKKDQLFLKEYAKNTSSALEKQEIIDCMPGKESNFHNRILRRRDNNFNPIEQKLSYMFNTINVQLSSALKDEEQEEIQSLAHKYSDLFPEFSEDILAKIRLNTKWKANSEEIDLALTNILKKVAPTKTADVSFATRLLHFEYYFYSVPILFVNLMIFVRF